MPVAVPAIGRTITGWLTNGLPRQFRVMKANSRCPILFHLLAPGGRWQTGLPQVWGPERISDNLWRYSLSGMARVAWILRLVEAGAGGDDRGTDVMEIAKPDDLRDIASLGLSLAEAKQVLAAIQREVVAAQAGDHAVRRPTCRPCGGACHVKDYRRL